MLDENPAYSPRQFLEGKQTQLIANLTTEKTLDWSNVLLSISLLANLLARWKIPLRLEFKNAVHKRSSGSTARAKPGRPSVTRLIQRI